MKFYKIIDIKTGRFFLGQYRGKWTLDEAKNFVKSSKWDIVGGTGNTFNEKQANTHFKWLTTNSISTVGGRIYYAQCKPQDIEIAEYDCR